MKKSPQHQAWKYGMPQWNEKQIHIGEGRPLPLEGREPPDGNG